MAGIFSGLSKFGLMGMDSLDIYEKEEKVKESLENTQTGKEVKETEEKDIIFDKKYICPVCDREFKSKTVMSGKAKLVSIDTDLRPKYQGIDPVKYDCVMCNHCGYSVLTRYFAPISSGQVKLIKDNISANFRSVEFGTETYSYDDAIVRYQMALASSVVKKGKISERAYACLKLAWLMRGKMENLDPTDDSFDEVVDECRELEDEYIKTAYDGFIKANQSEMFPICGMDEWTFTLVIAELARKCKDYENSVKHISKIITSKSATKKIKDRARELKDMIKDEIKNNQKES